MKVLNKKEKKQIVFLVKNILSNMTNEERAGYNKLYKLAKEEGFSDEKFYAELIEHFRGVKND